jgi:hypothetical protein
VMSKEGIYIAKMAKTVAGKPAARLARAKGAIR